MTAILTVEVFGTRHAVEDAIEHGALVEFRPACENFVTVTHRDEASRWVALGLTVECPDCVAVRDAREPLFGPY